MEKMDIRFLDLSSYDILYKDQKKCIYYLESIGVIKIFSRAFIKYIDSRHYNLEEKIKNARNIVPQIVTPTAIVYYKNYFCGYVMPFASGVNYDLYNSSKDVMNLDGYINLYQVAREFLRLEEIIKSVPNIVFPNLLNLNNIIINKSNSNIDFSFIDYDNIQIDNFKAYTVSKFLGDFDSYMNKKYMANGLFTKELDIKSLIHLYFSLVLNLDLSKFSVNSYQTNLLDSKLYYLGVPSFVREKVVRLFDLDATNEYLGNSMMELASNYNVQYENGVKRLVRKKVLNDIWK